MLMKKIAQRMLPKGISLLSGVKIYNHKPIIKLTNKF